MCRNSLHSFWGSKLKYSLEGIDSPGYQPFGVFKGFRLGPLENWKGEMQRNFPTRDSDPKKTLPPTDGQFPLENNGLKFAWNSRLCRIGWQGRLVQVHVDRFSLTGCLAALRCFARPRFAASRLAGVRFGLSDYYEANISSYILYK